MLGSRKITRREQGNVANEVETEQIVTEAGTTGFYAPPPRAFDATDSVPRAPSSRYTSYVQVSWASHHNAWCLTRSQYRGSIPVAWSQDNTGMNAKPPIDCKLRAFVHDLRAQPTDAFLLSNRN